MRFEKPEQLFDFVYAAGQAAEARAAFLVPTCTYAAYANFRSRVTGRWNELYHGRLTVLDRTDWLLARADCAPRAAARSSRRCAATRPTDPHPRTP